MKKILALILPIILILNVFAISSSASNVNVKIAIGDIDGSGAINNRDLGVLLKALSGWEVDDIYLDVADVNGDNEINNKDFGLLMQYVNGWDVTLVDNRVDDSSDDTASSPTSPTFEFEYKNLDITNDYVIVYAPEKWDNRYESCNPDGSLRAVNETAFSRICANDLAKYFNEEYALQLVVVRDTDPIATSATKKILVGDTAFYKSNLADNEYAVKVVNDNLIFEGGHFTMVEKAVDWYQTIEKRSGMVPVLNGKQDDFKSSIIVDGIKYDYVWGDEFDGEELIDSDKWIQGTFGLERQDDLVNIFGDERFQYVENGQLRLTADRYFDPANPNIGYATSGQIDTDGKMLFRNGYYEFRARMPYSRGAFPAIWTMSADAMGQQNVPNYNYDDGYGIYSKRLWDIEFDLFENFADRDFSTTTIHKWYTSRNNTSIGFNPVDLTIEEEYMVEADQQLVREKNGQWVYDKPLVKTTTVNGYSENVYYYVNNGEKVYVNQTQIDTDAYYQYLLDNGTLKEAHIRYPVEMYVLQSNGSYRTIDTFKYRLSPYTNMGRSMSTYAYQFSYLGNKGDSQNGITGSIRRKDDFGLYGDWRYYFDKMTINNEYHNYQLHLTAKHCTVSVDGNKFLDFDWDPAFDYKDIDGDGRGDDISNNNNGVGFNFWQYFLIDMMIYTPNNFKIDEARKLQNGDVPLHLYIDYVRCYQDLDDNSQAIYYPNALVQ